MSLGTKLQALRAAADLSQEELAEHLSVSRQAVSKWELDKTVPDAKYIVAISERFGVTTDYLLKEAEDAPPPPADRPLPQPSKPVRATGQTASALLVCGSVLFATLLAVSLDGERLGSWPLISVLVLAPVLLAVSRWLLGVPARQELRRYRRAFAVCFTECGFAVALLCGFSEIFVDLLMDRVEGAVSIPLFLLVLAALLLPLWGVGRLLGRFISG